MKSKLEKHLKIDKEKIKVIPIIETQEFQKVKEKYICIRIKFSKHKNHFRLFQAFVNVCKEKQYNIELNLTIEKELYKKSFYNSSKKPKNLKIINHELYLTLKLENYIIHQSFLFILH